MQFLAKHALEPSLSREVECESVVVDLDQHKQETRCCIAIAGVIVMHVHRTVAIHSTFLQRLSQ